MWTRSTGCVWHTINKSVSPLLILLCQSVYVSPCRLHWLLTCLLSCCLKPGPDWRTSHISPPCVTTIVYHPHKTVGKSRKISNLAGRAGLWPHECNILQWQNFWYSHVNSFTHRYTVTYILPTQGMFEKSKLIMRFFGIYEIFLRFLRCFEISFDYMEGPCAPKIRDRCGTYWKIALTTKLLFRLCDNFYLVVDSVTGLRSQKLITKIDHKKDGQPGRVEVAVKAVWR